MKIDQGCKSSYNYRYQGYLPETIRRKAAKKFAMTGFPWIRYITMTGFPIFADGVSNDFDGDSNEKFCYDGVSMHPIHYDDEVSNFWWRGFQRLDSRYDGDSNYFFFSIDEDLNEFVSSIPLTRFIAIFLSFYHHPKEFTKKSLFEFKYGYFASKCKKEVRWGRGGLLGKVDHPKMIREGITLLVFFYSSLKCFPLGI